MTRTRTLFVAALFLLLGLVELVFGLVQAELLQLAGDLGLWSIGWGPFVALGNALSGTLHHAELVAQVKAYGSPEALPLGQTHLFIGGAAWLVGWGLLAVTLRNPEAEPLQLGAALRSTLEGFKELLSKATFGLFRYTPPPPPANGLHPRLAKFVDFHWGTLLAYGFGFLISELVFIRLYLGVVGKGTVQGGAVVDGLPPVSAFLVAFAVAMFIAFAGGFLGAANSKRLSTPEATLALLYFGLPVPLLLTLMHYVPRLMIDFGANLRELIYLASLLGENRPELSYWLLTAALALGFFLGINFGFVSTSSGRLDLRASYELFVATRHVAVFRWRLLGGVFAVLIMGIIPPLLLWAIVQAAEKVVERTRIKRLGLKDPLAAAHALNEVKRKAQTPTEMMTFVSVMGVGVGVMALIIVLSVMSGFEADLQKKILGTNSHGVVMKYAPEMPDWEEVLAKVEKVRGIAGATPFILNEVMISSEGNISGSMIKGIDPKTVGRVTDLPDYLLPGGKLEWLDDPSRITRRHLGDRNALDEPLFDDRPATVEPRKPEKKQENPGGVPDIERDPLLELPSPEKEAAADVVLPGIIIGRELAASLKVVVGDRVNVVSPLGGELGPQGPMPKSRPFRVAGIFYSGMYEYDSKFVYIQLKEAESFFNIKGATGIEVKVTDVDNARGTMKAVYDTLQGYPYRTKDWGEMNRNLFAALRLEKLVMGIILSIIVIVAAGLIVATVIMLVLEKRKEIAVLKALGVPDGGIVKIFLMEGLQIGVAGGVLGLISGLAWCVFIERVGIKLDPQVYYIPALPVRIEPFQTALSVVIAILVTFLASIYPALQASEVEPVDGLKSE
ncbi:MAG: FtsX-like permease family protein [Myxococcota bacterium]